MSISSVGDDIYTHTLEDTIKNLKHGSDSLASILCDYQYCDINTTQKLVVLTCQIIKNKLTIMKYSPGNLSRWIAVEVRSCTIPLSYENRKDSIKLYEAFAYIYVSKAYQMYISGSILISHLFQSTLREQIKVYDKLADERLGFTIVEEKNMVRNCNYFFEVDD